MSLTPTGNKAPPRNDRSVTTSGASITFSTHVGERDLNDVPALIIDARIIEDTDPEERSLTSEKLKEVTSLDSLEAIVSEFYYDNIDYLEADDLANGNKALATAGSRKKFLFDAITSSLALTGLSEEDYPKARRFLKAFEEETYMGRYIEFDTAELDTYHPYEEPFDKGLKKLEALAPPGFERDNITHELNYIIDRKSQFGQGPINERNAETTLHLRPVDRDNDNQAISVATDSTNPQRPTYVLINVNKDNLPEGMEEFAGRAALRGAEGFYFDKSDDPVPVELHEHLSEKSASNNLGLRRFEGAEVPRANFPYDWDRNGAIDVDTIDTSWWGHCHIEASLAALDIKAGADVTVFDTRSKAVKTFGDTDINDLLFAMLDASSYADIATSEGATAGKTTFVGNRNDTTGGKHPGDKLFLEVDGVEHSFSFSVTSLFDPNDSGETVNVDEIFSPTVLRDGIRFEKNPAFQSLRDSDWSVINGERKLIGKVEYLDVSVSGALERQSVEITLDPTNPSKEPVLLGGVVQGGGYPPEVTKFYLNEITGNLESRDFSPEQQEDGTFKMVPVSEEATIVGAVSNKLLARELVKESIIPLHEHALNAARRGVSFVTEKSSGNAVWNYGTDSLKIGKLRHDGDFTKYYIALNTQGGMKRWTYILQSDQDGNPIAAHALRKPADFVWRAEHSVAAPLFRGEDGRLLYNESAYERGFLLDSEGELNVEGMSFFRYASDVIYASLRESETGNQYVVIDDDGELYFYDDVEAYKAEVTTLGGDTNEIVGETVSRSRGHRVAHNSGVANRNSVASSLLRPRPDPRSRPTPRRPRLPPPEALIA